jgi:thiamine biosynthesis lipoprotein
MVSYERIMPLVGGKIAVIIHDIPQEYADLLFEDIYCEAKRLEKIFNLYDPKSALSMLNRDRRRRMPREFIEVIESALSYCRLTDGAFDISRGNNFLERKGCRPLSELGCSYRDIVVCKDSVCILHKDVLIDLGAIAKGYIGDRLADFMKGLGIESGFIDMRGDLIAFGRHGQRVMIRHPRSPEKLSQPFVLKDRAVATSGDYRQYFGSFEASHIVGMRDFSSVSVVADKLMEADACATCLCLVGKEGQGRLLDNKPRIGVLAYDSDQAICATPGFQSIAVEVSQGG